MTDETDKFTAYVINPASGMKKPRDWRSRCTAFINNETGEVYMRAPSALFVFGAMQDGEPLLQRGNEQHTYLRTEWVKRECEGSVWAVLADKMEKKIKACHAEGDPNQEEKTSGYAT